MIYIPYARQNPVTVFSAHLHGRHRYRLGAFPRNLRDGRGPGRAEDSQRSQLQYIPA
jgi:hypothetical protein